MQNALILAGVLVTVLGPVVPCVRAQPDGATVIFDMDTARHKPGQFGDQKTPVGTVEVVEGKFNKACKFTFAPDARGGFFTASVKATPEWDRTAGISFWVKGDGSASWGGLEMIDGSNYALRYGYCFPIDSTEWRKITVPWCDLVPELPAGKLVDPKGAAYVPINPKGETALTFDGKLMDPKAWYAPSGFGNLWFGKWFYWHDYPACSCTIDQVALERSIAVDTTDYTPTVSGTPRLLAKLKAKQPVTIVTMGDSLSDKRHWANRQVLWSEVLVARLKEQSGGEVKLVNPAIGGTQLTQNLVLMPRWLKDAPEPDLVTVWFGFNDWDGGMRGEHFAEMLRFAVDRIRRLTKGKSQIVLITTCPAVARWDTMQELAAAVRKVAAEKKTGLADVDAAFHKAGRDEPARPALFCWDKVHLGEAGHKLAAETVLQAVAGQERTDRADPSR